MNQFGWSLLALALNLWVGSGALAMDELYKSQRLTPSGEYTKGIEGPAVDRRGNLYVVNLHRQGTIGILRSGMSRSELFATLPKGSVGNGIRIDAQGRMYVADYRKHTIYLIERDQEPRIYFRSSHFTQPNDLALSPAGVLFASDPDFTKRTGRIWMIKPLQNGGVGASLFTPRRMGVTNGIDVSPDGTTLYVSESDTRQVWAYRIDNDMLNEPRLVWSFADGELDGLRTDIDGKIYVARPGSGRVAILEPSGSLVREVRTTGRNPTNLTFGGVRGTSAFVTQADGRYIEVFEVDRPGREFCQHGWVECAPRPN
ncbi:SMP-30/gluconolactonase/LRE family protein [Microvirga sp. 0TCS3.31]